MHIKKHLGFDALIQDYSDCINKVVDQRRKASTDYTVHDVMMSALACMYVYAIFFFARFSNTISI